MKHGDRLNELSAELEAYCEAQRLPYLSADEMLHYLTLDEDQRRWLSDFVLRWDAEEKRGRKLYECGREARQLVELGAWTRAEADKAIAYLEENSEYLGLTSTEALDLARDLT